MSALRGSVPFVFVFSVALTISTVGCDDDPSGGAAGASGAGGGLAGSGGSLSAGSGGSSAAGAAGTSAAGAGGTGGGNVCAALPTKSGTITGSFKDFDGASHEVSLAELGCRTLYRRDGSVVGYQASFGTFAPGTSIDGKYADLPAFRLRLGASFAGDGTYEKQPVYVRATDGANLATSATVVVSNGGKSGAITLQDGFGSLSYTCDPSDRTDTQPGPGLTEAAGRLVVEDTTGVAAAFDNLACSLGGSVLQPSGPPFCTPSEYVLAIRPGVDAKLPGSYPLDPGSYAYLDGILLGRANTGPEATLTVTGAAPRAGTFEVPASSGGTHVPMKGSFTCPTPTP